MLRWLYRDLFRGLGIVFIFGMLIMLWLSVAAQRRHGPPHKPGPKSVQHRAV